MERFQALLLDIWREACRHIEIGESTRMIAAILVRHVPLAEILVRRIDRQRSCLETVAVGWPAAERVRADVRTEYTAGQIKKLLAWCRQGKATHRGSSAAIELRIAVPAELDAHVLVGPIGDPGGHGGLLILVAPPNRSFTDRHLALMQVLLDPFSVALDNDYRLHEMTALREAAEADKRSLLARLGRKKLGDTIIGDDSGLRAVMQRVELVARSNVPVLIFGETGTGKELVARAIHNRSSRSSSPFIRVNCGAIPSELIDSQLFGHERGAFTGAAQRHIGWFERADGGTLLLDEIGELPPAAQVRLLRVLQDGWLERVGGQQSINVDVRIVAATHRDLAGMVAEGRFREDLWYRIAGFPMVLPSLRERRGDIPRLAAYFAQRAATRFGLSLVMPSPEDVELLASYAWPGNVREFAAVIDRAAILGDGKSLEIAKSLGGTPKIPDTSAAIDKTEEPRADRSPKTVPLDTAIIGHIEAALALTNGRVEGPHGAAVLLEVNPHTLRARMRKLGIDWRQFRAADGTPAHTSPTA